MATGEQLPENVPPDIPYKFHPNTKTKAVNLTSQSEDARIVTAYLLQQNNQYRTGYTQLETKYRALKEKYAELKQEYDLMVVKLNEKAGPDVMKVMQMEKEIRELTHKNQMLDTENETLSEKNELLQNLNIELKENNNLLKENTLLLKESMKNQQTVIPQTYAQTLTTEGKERRINIPSIIVEVKTDDTSKLCTTSTVKQVLHKKTKCPIRKVKEVNNEVYIKCNNIKDVDEVSTILKSSEELNIKVETEKMRLPRITVVGVDSCMINMTNENIEADICDRNGLNENQQIRVIHKYINKKTSTLTLIMEVKAETYSKIMKEKKIFIGYDSKLNKADGVAMYVRKDLDYNVKCEQVGITKIISIETKIMGSKGLVISGVYRSHDHNKDHFIEDIRNFMELKKSIENHIIMGDFNINIHENDRYSNELLSNFYEMMYEPYFNKPTRIDSNSEEGNCIDNAFIKTNLDMKSFRVDQPFTDHYPLLLSLSRQIEKKETSNSIAKTRNKCIPYPKNMKTVWKKCHKYTAITHFNKLKNTQKMLSGENQILKMLKEYVKSP
ncbi:hypothetical protein QAD02_003035 [Eretmocerus hayati]|uniref:Uncharacterized protein n=1 Tax=Eretmocerus hayati TaxID=131215 RepID=A0ACC2NLH5_9HYME|nr:hypothetical protein QAD02_003035 [Eretmocerus hayati]